MPEPTINEIHGKLLANKIEHAVKVSTIFYGASAVSSLALIGSLYTNVSPELMDACVLFTMVNVGLAFVSLVFLLMWSSAPFESGPIHDRAYWFRGTLLAALWLIYLYIGFPMLQAIKAERRETYQQMVAHPSASGRSAVHVTIAAPQA